MGRNKVRSFLTMLGIVIGIMSVIVVMSVGAGAQSLILNQVSSLGSNLVGILPGQSEDEGPPASAMGIVITTLKYEDIKSLVGPEFPYIVAATAYVRGVDTVNWGDNKTDTNFVGVSAALPESLFKNLRALLGEVSGDFSGDLSSSFNVKPLS